MINFFVALQLENGYLFNKTKGAEEKLPVL